MDDDLQAIRALVKEASLPGEAEQAVLRGLDQLPTLYRELGRTYESRHADRIAELVRGMANTLTAAGPEARLVAETLHERLRAMHDRHGIGVTLKPLPAAKPGRKRKAG